MLNFLNKLISLSFYVLFLVVPLTFSADTSELFEFNKMWLTYGIAIVIASAWFSKMMLQKQLRIQRTPLDIPLGLFLLSQIISTIFSLDQHISFWGYYSRFNGGLLSIITYIFLYYAFVSNISLKQSIRYLYASIISGILVALWGLPSHFGYDPTCLLFRGTFDVSCWTNAFQPKVRIFSTMGQPDWLAAYVVMLTPFAFAAGAYFAKKKKTLLSILFFATTFLFYLDNLYTRARSGFIGMSIALILLLGWYAWSERKTLRKTKVAHVMRTHLGSTITIALLVLTTFFLGTGISQLDILTLPGLQARLTAPTPNTAPSKPTQTAVTPVVPTEFGGTDSGTIRLFVWEGALKIWKDHPIFGTGAETFAFAYYQYRPAGHNLTSEWDYLYNKAHNEYLNYLATTGLFGLGTYLAFIGLFLYIATKYLFSLNKTLHEEKNEKAIPETHAFNSLMLPALVVAFISILVTNFFGFSVVTMNTYLFLLPAFFFLLDGILPNDKVLVISSATTTNEPSGFAWLGISIVSIVGVYLIIVLIQYRSADVAYALGQNLDHAGEYQQAYALLQSAVQQRPDEPVFKDELAINESVLASALANQHNTADAQKLAQDAASLSTDVTTNHPNNVVFWKDRVRVMYLLSQIDPTYMTFASSAIQRAQTLAPTDAKISYNLGLIYGQSGQLDQAISILQNTIKLKPDYHDAYYALGIYYHQAALGKDGKTIVNPDKEKLAVDTMQFILQHFDAKDKQALESLTSWGEK